MAGNIQNVGFASPQALIAPDLIAQQQANEQQLALAQALREKAFQDDQVPAGSRVSWTQGLARLGEALAARKINKDANAKTGDMARQYAAALAAKFQAPQPAPTAAATGAALAPPQPADPSQDISGAMSGLNQQAQAVGVPVQNPQQASSVPPVAAATDPAPAPPSPAGAGVWSLSGNPQQDMSDYMLNPDKYGEAVIASHAPVDMAKAVQQAQAAMARGDMATASALLANIQKQNNIPLVSGRPGAPMFDHTGHIVGMSPQNIEGQNPVIENGAFTGAYTTAPGAMEGVQALSAAKAVGAASGDMVDVYNPATQSMIKVPKSVLLGNAANGGAPMQAGPALGEASAANVTGTNSANGFQAISEGAADVPNRKLALGQMAALVNDPNTILGPGSSTAAGFAGRFNTFAQTAGIPAHFNANTVTNGQEFQKWASQYSARSAQELGLQGSDARMNLAVHATPNGEMTAGALKAIIPQMVGFENAKQGRANAAVAWQQAHGPASLQQFNTAWNQIYDPKVYTLMAQGPKAFAGAVAQMKPAEAAQLRQKYIALKQAGALPQ